MFPELTPEEKRMSLETVPNNIVNKFWMERTLVL